MSRQCHPSATRIEPYQQGGLDSLCGLYAVINAARLLHAEASPLSGQRCRRLFAEGMDFLTAKRGSRDAAHWGMTVGRQRKLAKALFNCEALANLPALRLGPPLPHTAKVEELEKVIEATLECGAVLLVYFHGRISHHSVVVGQTAKRVLLFDSDGTQFIRKSSLRLSDERSGTLTLHALTPLVMISSA
jgi:hypothetical protein